MRDAKIFNSEITKTEFLEKYWNKKPALFKRAFPHAASLAEIDDLIELSEDESFETRLVYMEDDRRKMLHGPIESEELSKFKKGDFALLCHNLNTLSPDFYQLEQAVNFIPNWEFDDVMAVYSNDGMSLGAHIDNYNVFILQGQGGRTWQIQTDPNVAWKEDQEIKVLKEFHPDFEWDLEPGDLIYIPPGIAHHGITKGESVSYSIGFKSLETVDMIGEYMASLKEEGSSTFYKSETFNKESSSDANLDPVEFFNKEARILISSKSSFNEWFKKRITRPKFPIEKTGESAPVSYKNLELQRDAYLKYALFKASNGWELSINENLYFLDDGQKNELLKILDSSPFETFSIQEEKKIKPILDELFESGCIFPIEN